MSESIGCGTTIVANFLAFRYQLNENSNHRANLCQYFLRQYFDVVAIFCLAVLPDLIRSFIQTNSTGDTTTSFSTLLCFLVVRSLQVSLPILLVMRLRNVNWDDYGFCRFRPVLDPLVAIGIAVIGYGAYYASAVGLLYAGFDFSADSNALQSMTHETQFGFWTMGLVIASSFANGFAEELAIRSYLLVRIGELSGSFVAAAVATTILFAAYHSYQGRYGIVSALAIGATFATYFVITKRFWPVAIAHILMDIAGLTSVLTQNAG